MFLNTSALQSRAGLGKHLSKRKNYPSIIIELKADGTPETAIAQIKEKEYNEKLRKVTVEKILAVAINYDTGKKAASIILTSI